VFQMETCSPVCLFASANSAINDQDWNLLLNLNRHKGSTSQFRFVILDIQDREKVFRKFKKLENIFFSSFIIYKANGTISVKKA